MYDFSNSPTTLIGWSFRYSDGGLYMQEKLSKSPAIWLFLAFCICAGNLEAYELFGKFTPQSCIIGTILFGILIRFAFSLAPAFIFRKLLKRNYKFNEYWLLVISGIIYIFYIYSFTFLIGFTPTSTRLGLPDIWAIWLWTYIINYGRSSKITPPQKSNTVQTQNHDISILVQNNSLVRPNFSNPYRYINQPQKIECYEKLDGQWVKTGEFDKTTLAIKPIEITKDTMIHLGEIYFYFKRTNTTKKA